MTPTQSFAIAAIICFVLAILLFVAVLLPDMHGYAPQVPR
jgi:hypothetical protein